MARDSAIKQQMAETQKKLDPILGRITDLEAETEVLRHQARMLQVTLDHDDQLLAMEEALRKSDQEDAADQSTEES